MRSTLAHLVIVSEPTAMWPAQLTKSDCDLTMRRLLDRVILRRLQDESQMTKIPFWMLWLMRNSRQKSSQYSGRGRNEGLRNK